jgi:hypothetical protein
VTEVTRQGRFIRLVPAKSIKIVEPTGLPPSTRPSRRPSAQVESVSEPPKHLGPKWVLGPGHRRDRSLSSDPLGVVVPVHGADRLLRAGSSAVSQTDGDEIRFSGAADNREFSDGRLTRRRLCRVFTSESARRPRPHLVEAAILVIIFPWQGWSDDYGSKSTSTTFSLAPSVMFPAPREAPLSGAAVAPLLGRCDSSSIARSIASIAS